MECGLITSGGRFTDLVPGDETPRTAGCPGLEELEVSWI
jgi:hypothetical protein